MLSPKLTRSLVASIAILVGLTRLANAHSAEQGFILLLPTDIYITSGTLAVTASIVLISILRQSSGNRLLTSIHLPVSRINIGPWISIFSTFAIWALIWIGFSGPRDPLSNLLPLTIWTIWWVGFVACLPILGNLWAHVNPWTGLYTAIIRDQKPLVRMPEWMGIWPGVLIFTAFHIFAIADVSPSDPYRLACIVSGYWVITFIGMLLFGSDIWLSRAEGFTIFFRLIASLAPIQNGRIGFPSWATLRLENIGLSHAAFCILILGAGSFDGLHETFWWLAEIGINPLEFPGRSAVVWTSTFGLIATCLALGAAFMMCIWTGLALTKQNVPLKQSLPLFALTLIPIAFGYHFAHYLTSFLINIQYASIALSDPFVSGADYIGLSKLQVTTGFLSDPATVKIIWITQATVVVASHITAVIAAHAVAGMLYQSHRDIVLAQLPLSLLMIAYTVFGLWLLASPRGV